MYRRNNSTQCIELVTTRDIESCNFCGESLEFYDNVARWRYQIKFSSDLRSFRFHTIHIRYLHFLRHYRTARMEAGYHTLDKYHHRAHFHKQWESDKMMMLRNKLRTMDATVPILEPLFHLVDHHKGDHDHDHDDNDTQTNESLLRHFSSEWKKSWTQIIFKGRSGHPSANSLAPNNSPTCFQNVKYFSSFHLHLFLPAFSLETESTYRGVRGVNFPHEEGWTKIPLIGIKGDPSPRQKFA